MKVLWKIVSSPIIPRIQAEMSPQETPEDLLSVL